MIKHIFVGCMPFGFSEDDIRTEFERYGRVEEITLKQDLENATFDSYAHVRIETDDVSKLLDELDGKRIANRLLRVNEVVHREDYQEDGSAPQAGTSATSEPALACER